MANGGIGSIFAEMRKDRIQAVNEEKEAKKVEEQEQLNEAVDIPEDGVEPKKEKAPKAKKEEPKGEKPEEESSEEEKVDEEISNKRHKDLNEGCENDDEACNKDEEDLTKAPNQTHGLNINKKATNGRAFTVDINGKKYSYYPTEESGLTAKELGEKYNKIAKYSVGKALAWLKKNATTPDSYRKAANEEQVDEEITLNIDVDDILKAAGEINKAQADGKTVTVTQTVKGFKVDVVDDGEEPDEPDDVDPEAVDEPEEERAEEECKEEKCPKCGKKHPKGTDCCEDTNEEVDVAELAARLDECQGSDYMRKALEQGKYEMVQKYLYLKED